MRGTDPVPIHFRGSQIAKLRVTKKYLPRSKHRCAPPSKPCVPFVPSVSMLCSYSYVPALSAFALNLREILVESINSANIFRATLFQRPQFPALFSRISHISRLRILIPLVFCAFSAVKNPLGCNPQLPTLVPSVP